MDHEHHNEDGGGSRGKIVLVVFLAIAAFFLFTEHRAHLFGFLPFLLVLACPLMHMFMHGGHGGHGGHSHSSDEAPRRDAESDRKEAQP